MNFIKGTNEPLFRLSRHTLRKFHAAGPETANVHIPQEELPAMGW